MKSFYECTRTIKIKSLSLSLSFFRCKCATLMFCQGARWYETTVVLMTLYPHATLSTSISNVLTRGGPLWARSRNYPAEVCSSNTLNGKRSDLSVRYVYYIPTIHTTCSPSLMPCIFPREKNSFEFLSFQLNNSRHS